MRIAIDVDDVACNFLAQCLSIMNKRHRTDYTVSQFNEFNIYNCISKKDADILANIFNEQEVWDNMLPPSDAQATIKKMVSAGNDVFFVSACHPSTHEWKTNWLERVYPFVPAKNHIYTEHKDLLLVDCIIDDNVDWLRRSVATRIIMTRPWNIDEHTGFDVRVDSLTDAWNEICKFEKEKD